MVLGSSAASQHRGSSRSGTAISGALQLAQRQVSSPGSSRRRRRAESCAAAKLHRFRAGLYRSFVPQKSRTPAKVHQDVAKKKKSDSRPWLASAYLQLWANRRGHYPYSIFWIQVISEAIVNVRAVLLAPVKGHSPHKCSGTLLFQSACFFPSPIFR